MKTPSQPRAIYYIVAIQIWEYFSFYGMRALLILYLTHQLGFDDSHAIQSVQRLRIFSLRYPYSRRLACRPPARQPHGGDCRGAVNDPRPRGAGRRVDLRMESVRRAGDHHLRLRPVQINISCLLGELYAHDDPRRDGGFSLLYAAGNVGSIAAPIACGLAAQWYGWHIGFALAGIGMFIGLMIFS